ncbi:MAG TPA: hypothetical protein VI485_08095 [Vicinamibacterales bacterium]|nr:hypothetical protein [Vicinamibacterales bacterium]
MVGFDTKLLERLKPTGETRTLGGLRFVRYAATAKAAVSQGAWWNADQALPSSFVMADAGGLTRLSLQRVRSGADLALLRPPASRFPTYRVIDLADWLERH